MRITVIGAGIGGSAVALALHKAGFSVSVYEAHPESGHDIGAFLTLASNGMRALAEIDAAITVANVGFALTSMQILAEDGAVLAKNMLGASEDPLTRFRCLRRARLGAALRAEVLNRGIPIWHGCRLVAADERSDGVTATFASGDTAHGDLLIGADGLKSTLRMLIDARAPEPRYAGQRVFYGYTNKIVPQAEPEEITMISGSTAAFGFAISPTNETYWFARVPHQELPSDIDVIETTSARWRDILVPLLRVDGTPAADIVAATEKELLVTNACDLPCGLQWHTRRMIILGDAAHAASPATGQGASMAIEDAVVLAKALRDIKNLDEALRCYEQIRRPRVEQNIAASARMTVNRMPNPEQRALNNENIRQRPSQTSPSHIDVELQRQLDWNIPLS